MANDFVFVVMCSSMPSRRRSRRSHTSSDPRHRHTRWQHHFQNSTLPIRRNNFVIEERTSAELDLTARLINTTLTLNLELERQSKVQNTQYNTIEEGGAAVATSVHKPVEDTCAVHTHTHSHAQQRRNEISMIHTQPAMASSFAHWHWQLY